MTGGPLAFGDVTTGTTSSPQTLTVTNTTAATTISGISVSVTAPFARDHSGTFPAGAPDCGTTLAVGGVCTIKVAFSPTADGPASGTVTIAASVPVTGSPVSLSGNGVAPVVAASFLPTNWTTSAVRGCATGGLCPTQVFTLTNDGNVELTGIAAPTLGGSDASEFTIVQSLSTCGTNVTSLAPNATCAVTVQFTPLTSQTRGQKTATVSVGAGAAGTKTSTLKGQAQ